MHERAISFRRLQIRASGITERVTVNLPNPTDNPADAEKQEIHGRPVMAIGKPPNAVAFLLWA